MTGVVHSDASGVMSARPVLGEQKAPAAFRTISEVATNLDVPQHVLRFWETKFQQVKPLKRGGGRRYYRPEDVVLLTQIKDLLYNQGLTIRGVQKLLKETGKAELSRLSATQPSVAMPLPSTTTITRPSAAMAAPVLSAAVRREMEGVLEELKSLRELLRQSGV